MRQLALDLAAVPLPTLENFVEGGNGELLQVLKRLLNRIFHNIWRANPNG